MRRRRLTVQPLGSGSSGNSTLVAGPEGSILVDAGFSAREILGRLREAGTQPADIRAVIVTHAHGDHAKGAALVARRLRVPIWASRSTLNRLWNLNGKEELAVLSTRRINMIAGLAVEALTVNHDAPGTVIVKLEGRVALATDLGTVTPREARFLSGLEGLLLEFNHDPEMLANGPYPPWLKARVASNRGHLSNEQAAALLVHDHFVPPKRVLWLAHLSQKNNRPGLARAAARTALGKRRVRMVVTRPDMPSPAVVLS
jgi:phosphoribosyl 1,2-cyclic phosphodiesterase